MNPDYAPLNTFLRRFIKQVFFSIPHYLEELKEIRRPHDLYEWTYFKFPNYFPLASFPTYLSIEATNICNFSCEHCWRSIMTRSIGSIEIDLFDKIIREAVSHGLSTIKIAGAGEAALHPRFQELISLLSSHNIRGSVYTNGTLLRMYPHREILESNLYTLVVSVDGLDAKSYERIRIGGKYDPLRKSLSAFYNLRNHLKYRLPQIEIRHVIMPDETPSQLLEFRKSWLPMADTVKFNYLQPLKGDKIWNQFRPKCRDIRREFSVLWDGKVPLCQHEYKHEYIGNVHSTSIKELWRHPKKEFVRECHKSQNLKKVPLCMTCPP
jgi:radical SAM protein with 4Fe4S-binding SPASM domain